MRPTAKISVRLLVLSISCTCLLFVLCNSVWTQETKKANPNIKELQKQRLAVLEEIRDSATKLFQNARISYEDVLLAERDLLAARIAHAETRKDRIKVCDEAVQNAIESYKFLQERVKEARVTRVTELKAKAFLLETQIARANAETED